MTCSFENVAEQNQLCDCEKVKWLRACVTRKSRRVAMEKIKDVDYSCKVSKSPHRLTFSIVEYRRLVNIRKGCQIAPFLTHY